MTYDNGGHVWSSCLWFIFLTGLVTCDDGEHIGASRKRDTLSAY